MVDPIDKVLVIFTKTTGVPSAFHRIGAFTAGGKSTTEKIDDFTYELAIGEALDLLPDGTGYVTTNEGASTPINETPFKESLRRLACDLSREGE